VIPDKELPFAAPSSAGYSRDRQAALQKILDQATASKDSLGVRGITAAVVSAKGSWSGASGVDGSGTPLVPTSMMDIASITKTFTAAEILHLAAAGKLSLDAPASRYLTHPLLARHPTVRQLLAMTSGVPEFAGDALLNEVRAHPSKHWTARESLSHATGQLADPGRTFDYSNSNYLLLGLVIENVTGLTYAQALRRDLLAGPSGRLAVQDEERPTPPLAGPDRSLGDEPDGRYVPNRAAASLPFSAGAIAADASTVARWGFRLYGGLIVPPAQVQQMTTRWPPAQDGLGTEIRTFRDQATVGHTGIIPGYAADLEVVPSLQIAVAILIPVNLDDPDTIDTYYTTGLLTAAME
jgi:CubicO group peptidase (beta-lactamase class C family)